MLASVFDIEHERGIIAGKIFDVKITIVATLLFGNVTVSTYVLLATRSGAKVLLALGLRKDVMGNVESSIGQGLAFFFIFLMFFALYKFSPIRRVRARPRYSPRHLRALGSRRLALSSRTPQRSARRRCTRAR